MIGTFACPECGRELEVEGMAPGGLVRCEDCATWVEIPFLPRAAPSKRWRSPRRRAPWERTALRAGLVLMGLALVAATASRMVGDRLRAGRERVLAELIASADAAESENRPDRALIEIEAAVARARAIRSDRLDALLERRDAASLREARSRLAALASLDPARAVGEALTLRDRAATDPALAPLAGAIAEALDDQRMRQAGADRDAARAALDAGRASDAFLAAARLHDHAGPLPPGEARKARDEAEALMDSAVSRFGVALPPASGRFLFGSIEAYNARLDGPWSEALRAKGYLPQPRRSPWRDLWDARAPFRATTEIVETPGPPFLQSRNLTTEIDGTLQLEQLGRVLWANRVAVTADAFPPSLSVHGGAGSAASNRRDPEVERRLHESTLARFVERASRKLTGLPDRATVSPAP
ncbi:hypothetical protein TA3x_001518 [Tundrisphaera sp. TA3]|uniref:hypothetical protein n=1 Tax=Tundrisphaera sp. TA3 TaxID=3435775 RepID=UPI003EBA7DBE